MSLLVEERDLYEISELASEGLNALIKPGQVVRLQAYRMTETGIRAVKAMREAPASEVRTFEAMVMAPPAGLARLAIPADVVNKIASEYFKR